MEITVESKKDTLRHGPDWIQKMAHDYGYIHDTVGADGDEVDCFVGDNLESESIFIVDQNNENGEFDEHKVMVGFNNIAEAKDAYFANYPEGWGGFKNISEIKAKDFWDWYEKIRKENSMSKENTLTWEQRLELQSEKLARGQNQYGSKENDRKNVEADKR